MHDVELADFYLDATTVTNAQFAVFVNATGYVTARRQATVSSKVTGKVIEVFIEEGMRVKAGQELARLDASYVSRGLSLAQAEAQAAAILKLLRPYPEFRCFLRSPSGRRKAA